MRKIIYHFVEGNLTLMSKKNIHHVYASVNEINHKKLFIRQFNNNMNEIKKIFKLCPLSWHYLL